DADDLLLVDRVVEERRIALLHRLQVHRRQVVAHAVPVLGAFLDLHLPGPRAGLALDQPMRHHTLSCLSGRASSARTHSSISAPWLTMRSTVAAIGMSTPSEAASATSGAALNMPSATE